MVEYFEQNSLIFTGDTLRQTGHLLRAHSDPAHLPEVEREIYTLYDRVMLLEVEPLSL